MSYKFPRFLFLSLFVLSCFCAGCGPKGPAVNPVAGAVTLDGKPLAEASVRFTPKEGAGGEAAAGGTDASGNLVGVKTLSTGDLGVVAGEYIVTVSKTISKQTGSYTKPETGETVPIMEAQETLPPMYATTSKTPLTVSISKGENTITLEVKSK